MLIKTQRKGAETPQEMELKSPARVGGPSAEVWVGRSSPQGWWHWQQQAWKVHLGMNTLGGCH